MNKIVTVLVALAALSNDDLASSSVYAVDVRSFLVTHCYECHDADAQEGNFQMERISTEKVTADSVNAWSRILTRLESGDMPPPKHDRPPSDEIDAVLNWCKQSLAAEARESRGAGGTLTRRLNRLEYENTVRDLLGVAVDLRTMLPEDDRAEGFDTAAEALRISPVHIQRYMAAADVALQAALMRGEKPEVVTTRYSYDHEKEHEFFGQKSKGRMLVRHEGELQFYSEPGVEHPAFLRQLADYTKKNPGLYKVRVAARTLDAQGQSVTFGVRTASQKRKLGIRSLGWFDAPADTAQVFEMETRFAPGDTVIVEPYRLNDMRRQRGYSQYAPGDPVVGKDRKKLENPRPPSGLALGIAWVEVEGPIHETWPPAGHQRLFGNVPMRPFNKLPKETNTPGSMQRLRQGTQLTPVSARPAEDARRLLGNFLPRAFRRPVTEEDIAPYYSIAEQHWRRSECFEAAMMAAYRAVLCSPDFLFLPGSQGPMNDHALASRLSYFLWRTAPDETLRGVADRGELRQSAILRRETERLLASPRAKAFVDDFLDQWLHLREIGATLPDKHLFPEFFVEDGGRNFKEDPVLIQSILNETRLFFAELIENDASLLNLIDSDFTYLNQRLAKYYQLPPVTGTAMQRVSLPAGSPRGGVLTQASVLKVTANGTRTSPVVRGVWIMENILGRKPLPPPPTAGSIDPDTRGSTTIREQLAKHQSSDSCASCHRQIDPPGYALESFDPAGQWREIYRTIDGVENVKQRRPQPEAASGETLQGRDVLGPVTWLPSLPVDATGMLINGKSFKGPDQFKKLMLQEPRLIARCLASKLITYASGRATQPGDILELESIVAQSEERQYGLRSLIHAVVQSELFRSH